MRAVEDARPYHVRARIGKARKIGCVRSGEGWLRAERSKAGFAAFSRVESADGFFFTTESEYVFRSKNNSCRFVSIRG